MAKKCSWRLHEWSYPMSFLSILLHAISSLSAPSSEADFSVVWKQQQNTHKHTRTCTMTYTTFFGRAFGFKVIVSRICK